MHWTLHCYGNLIIIAQGTRGDPGIPGDAGHPGESGDLGEMVSKISSLCMCSQYIPHAWLATNEATKYIACIWTDCTEIQMRLQRIN